MDELNNLAMSALAITQIGFSFFALPLLLPGKGLSLLLNLGLLYLCYSYLKKRGELEVQDRNAEGRQQLEHLLSEEQTQQP